MLRLHEITRLDEQFHRKPGFGVGTGSREMIVAARLAPLKLNP